MAELMRQGYSESSAHAICTHQNAGGIKEVRKHEASKRKKKPKKKGKGGAY